jgi:hypothetical protein
MVQLLVLRVGGAEEASDRAIASMRTRECSTGLPACIERPQGESSPEKSFVPWRKHPILPVGSADERPIRQPLDHALVIVV